ncbi:hypothetical protein ACFL27_22720, partial [candidate division CSSED10-310 bacterium]
IQGVDSSGMWAEQMSSIQSILDEGGFPDLPQCLQKAGRETRPPFNNIAQAAVIRGEAALN